jgi:integrase/recombinase XerC
LQIFQEFLQQISIKGFSKKTQIAYAGDLKLFETFIKKYINSKIDIKTLTNLDIKDFRSFFSYLFEKQELSPTSRSRVLSTLRSFYKHLKKRKYIEDSAIFSISFPKTDKLCPRALSVHNISRIIDALDENTDNWVGIRNKTLFLLNYASGMRISELLSLTDNMIFEDFIKVVGKGNKERIIPLIPEAKTAINEYLKAQPFKLNKDDEIFRGEKGGKLNPRIFQRVIEDLRYKLNLDDNFTPHSLRHSFATHLIENEANLRQVQELLGHTSISSTEKYLKITNKHLVEQFQKYQTFKKES